MTTDENDTGWDSLAEEFGLEAETPAPKAETPATPARPARPARAPKPEPEEDAGDFGEGVEEKPTTRRAALFDPGPEVVDAEADEFDDAAPEPLDDADDGEEGPDSAAEEVGDDTQEGGKRKRKRRRRRKKKGGPETAPADVAAEADEEGEVDANAVEEGDAPAEIEGDEDDEDGVAPSAVDEEMDAEAARPRPEWHVMTWAELVSKLHRPN